MAEGKRDYKGELKPVWCPGCGAYAVLNAVLKALDKKGYRHSDLVFVGGIGCGSRFAGYIKCIRLHTIHGRALPIAMGVKLAKPSLKVVVVGGEGDGIAIGGNHFIHTARRNAELVYIMTDNSVYGMTKGQPSPTSPLGMVTKATPYGVSENPFDPVSLAIASGASYVARGFSGMPGELEIAVERAFEHKGFAFVHVLSPCATFNNTFEFLRGRVRSIEEHDETDRIAALKLASDPESPRLGVYLDIKTGTFDDKVHSLKKASEGDYLRRLIEKYE
jgi:2-oxoglutarate ferredoxin oxidoreductase subunit beta